GQAPAPSLLYRRPAARPLAFGHAALGRQAAFLRRPRGARGAALAPPLEPAFDAFRQALKRELAVARLAAGVLGDRGHAPPVARQQALALRGRERRGGLDVEHGLDARGGDVRVLSSRAG